MADPALAAGLQVSSGSSRRVWLQLGIACDVADTIAGLSAGRRGELSPTSTVLVTPPAVMGVALGLSALRKVQVQPASPTM